jgi:hypothetical protein
MVVYWGAMPRNQHHPTPAERDGRLKIDLDPDEAIKLILESGDHSREDGGDGEDA